MDLVPKITLDSALDEVFECRQHIQRLQDLNREMLPKSALEYAERQIQELKSDVSKLKGMLENIIPRADRLISRFDIDGDPSNLKKDLDAAIQKLEEEKHIVAKLRSETVPRFELHKAQSEIEKLNHQKATLQEHIGDLVSKLRYFQKNDQFFEGSLGEILRRLETNAQVCDDVILVLERSSRLLPKVTELRCTVTGESRETAGIGGFSLRNVQLREEIMSAQKQIEQLKELLAGTVPQEKIIALETSNDQLSLEIRRLQIAISESVPLSQHASLQDELRRLREDKQDDLSDMVPRKQLQAAESALDAERGLVEQMRKRLAEQGATFKQYVADLTLEHEIALELAQRGRRAAEPVSARPPDAEKERRRRDFEQAMSPPHEQESAVSESAVPSDLLLGSVSESVRPDGSAGPRGLQPAAGSSEEHRSAPAPLRRGGASASQSGVRDGLGELDEDVMRNRFFWR